jgi:hypothetical protein
MTDDIRNPYSPPLSTTPTFLAEASRPAAKRPISAWILMAFLAVTTLSTIVPALRMGWALASGTRQATSALGMIGWLAWVLGFSTLLVATILAIHRARPWARWVGLVLIVAFAALGLLRTDLDQYPNDGQRAGAAIAKMVLLPALFVWWAWAFAFTAKARAYFARRPADPVQK